MIGRRLAPDLPPPVPDLREPGDGYCAADGDGGDYISVPTMGLVGDASFTITGWAKRRTGSYNQVYSSTQIELVSVGTSLLRLTITGVGTIEWPASHVPTVWNHFAGSYDAVTDTARGFLNGASVGTTGAIGPLSLTNIGGRLMSQWGGGNALNGYLCHVTIWSVAKVAEAEIQAIMRSARIPAGTPGLAAQYRLDPGGGTIVPDSSGNGRHGTMGAAPATPRRTVIEYRQVPPRRV